MMQTAIKNVERAHQNLYLSRNLYNDARERGALRDCSELYELSIKYLNNTINTRNCTQVDVQTWLSSALTQVQTCQYGFRDLGGDERAMPTALLYDIQNVSCLISNALAINGDVSSVSSLLDRSKDKFPRWIGLGDQKSSSSGRANLLVVAQDGSGDYRTIGEAINEASRRNRNGRFVINIKTGIYKEYLEIGSKLENIMLLGDGIGKTIITGSKSVGGGTTTYGSATVAVMGDHFIAQGITIRNTAGPSNHQAVALRSNSDLSVFYKCSFEGYQDTLYVFSNRQFYRECNIYGTIDFIFGNAAAVLQNCNIYVRFSPTGTNTITAQGRTDPNQNSGISIHNSRVSSAEDLKGSKTYLGRPWQKYSRTVYMKTYLNGIIDSKGWLEWSGNFGLNTLYYGEYDDTGPGSSTSNRVKWLGYRVIRSAREAEDFSVAKLIVGNYWLPKTGIPFTSGL
ncbi:unnamed protein product [Amaranthus hypochondriacus]